MQAGYLSRSWAKELVMPHMKRCMKDTPKLKEHIKAMGRCGLKEQNTATIQLRGLQTAGLKEEQEV